MRRKNIALRDIAEKLGVSLMSVSRALHGKFGVSPELQRKIVAEAEKLGYIPSRNLFELNANRHSRTIGFVIPHLADTIFPEMFEAIESFFEERGWRVMMCCSYNSTVKEFRALSALIELGVGGILWCPVETNGYTHLRKTLRTTKTPLVLVDRRIPGFDADAVTVDDRAAMRRLVTHLASLGKRRIAYLGAASAASWTAKERKAGYLEALRAAGLRRTPSLILEVGSDVPSGIAGTRTLLVGKKRPDAICCYNDPLALGAEIVLLGESVAIPDEIALTGFSDTLATRLARVPITTVRQDGSRLGREAARLLHNRIVSPSTLAPIRKIIPTELCIRTSTAGKLSRAGLRRNPTDQCARRSSDWACSGSRRSLPAQRT